MVHILSFISYMYWENECKNYAILSVIIDLPKFITMVYEMNKSRDLKTRTGNNF